MLDKQRRTFFLNHALGTQHKLIINQIVSCVLVHAFYDNAHTNDGYLKLRKPGALGMGYYKETLLTRKRLRQGKVQSRLDSL